MERLYDDRVQDDRRASGREKKRGRDGGNYQRNQMSGGDRSKNNG